MITKDVAKQNALDFISSEHSTDWILAQIETESRAGFWTLALSPSVRLTDGQKSFLRKAPFGFCVEWRGTNDVGYEISWED